MSTVEDIIVFDRVYFGIADFGLPTMHEQAYDEGGLFALARDEGYATQISGGAFPTWREISNYCLHNDLPKNTVTELRRLNGFADADAAISATTGAFYCWGKSTSQGGGNCNPREPALRLAQRDDGLGPFAHPRLKTSTSAPSSIQAGVAPRVGQTNRYR